MGLGLLLTYTVVHFLYSGLYAPVYRNRYVGQFVEELEPLKRALETGDRVRVTNPRQYGPVFLFLSYPPTGSQDRESLADVLLGINYVILAAAFWLTVRACFRPRPSLLEWALLAVLWLNFSPLYYLIAVRNVELWELALLGGALHAYREGRRGMAGAAVALATLIKMLPALFLFYFLWRDQRAMAWAAGTLVVVLLLATAAFGPEMGIGYLPFLLTRALEPRSWAYAHFENVALKGLIFKAFAGFRMEPGLLTFRQTELAWLAGVLAFLVQGVGLLLLARFALRRRREGGEQAPHEWAVVLGTMLLISPLTAFEYSVLLLPGFTFAAWVLMRRPETLSSRAVLCLAGAYLLLGNFLPLSLVHYLP
ncbi:MAG: DUF2029 domain-containing protein, partial [Deltaproteobacteria bacterium]|nr:DUF2029 domain-containing protein [Deltaproteobacteria bacterium]